MVRRKDNKSRESGTVGNTVREKKMTEEELGEKKKDSSVYAHIEGCFGHLPIKINTVDTQTNGGEVLKISYKSKGGQCNS